VYVWKLLKKEKREGLPRKQQPRPKKEAQTREKEE